MTSDPMIESGSGRRWVPRIALSLPAPETYALSSVLPATYCIDLQRAIALRGASLGDFWPNAPRLKSNCYPAEGWNCSGCLKRPVTLMGYVTASAYLACQAPVGERPSGGGA